MIKKIGVKNFRVFKDYTEFELRPLTILTGPNNSGKSSFTKLLLLLKNGVTKLNFEEGKHNLTSYEDVSNWEKSKDGYYPLEISLSNLVENIDADIRTSLVFDDEGLDIIEFKIGVGNKSIYSCDFEEITDIVQVDGNEEYVSADCNQYLNNLRLMN